ncbi:MAG: hypothetical protein ABI685_11200 [Ferruginibacter sp.]
MKKTILLLLAAVCTSGIIYAQTGAAKIIFAKEQKPTAANSKESFTSGDFIYAGMDLAGKTVNDYFKLPAKSANYPYAYLFYVAEVYKGSELIGDNNWNMALVKEADRKSTVLNMDVLPDPAKATTVLSGAPMFDAGMAAGPLYSLVEKQYFNESGTYTIKIRIYNRTIDAYGNEQPYEKWPTCAGSFTFNFNEDDVAKLLKNGEQAATKAKNNAFK